MAGRGELEIPALSDLSACALVLGAEERGVRNATLAAADLRLRIPMAQGIDSLNVVAACAVALDRLGGARSASKKTSGAL
jgi:tRNA G18 (ribose-2'-O)-methylase SpoU